MELVVRRGAVIVITASFLVFPWIMAPASGDGMTHVYDDEYYEWQLSQERSQYGMINYVHGYERLLLAIKMDKGSLEEAESAVWIFAIPSDPGNASIDIMPAVEEFWGPKVEELAREEFSSNLLFGYGTQLYPLLAAPLIGTMSQSDRLLTNGGFGIGVEGFGTGVEVVQHVESHGLTSELLSAEDSVAFDAYLQDHGLTLDEGAGDLMGEYLGQGYSFIVSWITDVQEFASQVEAQLDRLTMEYYYELGLFVEFPTDRMFFPMRLTSVYGDAEVPMRLHIVGYVEPDESDIDYGALRIEVDHRIQAYYRYTRELYDFFARGQADETEQLFTIHDLEYTEVTVSAPSNELDADLWMVPTTSATLDLHLWVMNNGFLAAAATIIGLSVVTSVVAAVCVFSGYRPVLWKFAALGLANVLTIFGLWAVTRYLEVERTFIRSPVKAPASPYRMDFVVLYTFIFVVALTTVLMAFWT